MSEKKQMQIRIYNKVSKTVHSFKRKVIRLNENQHSNDRNPFEL